MINSDTRLPVLVVGGGPVGMTAAAALVRHRVPVLLIEAEPEPRPDWRASTFHPPTLELLDQLGVVDRMRAGGLVVPRYQFRDRREGLVAEFDFGLLAGETRYPYRLQINQQHLVRMIHEDLRSEPLAALHFGCRVVALEQSSDAVTATVVGGSGRFQLRGSYLVGADGAGSATRRLLGIGFDGFTYPERFMIVSTSTDMRSLIPDLGDVNYIADPRQWIFLLHTPESWRAVYPVPQGQSREAATSPQSLQAQLQAICARPDPYPIVDQQLYDVHQRVAATFRAGRAVLVGDAAHINSPIGGVGLNSGIHDAMDVAARLARIHHQGAVPGAELETFAELRRRVALEYVQADTIRNTERLKEADPARRRAQRAELRAIAADPERARQWVRRVSLLESVQKFGIGSPPPATGTAGLTR